MCYSAAAAVPTPPSVSAHYGCIGCRGKESSYNVSYSQELGGKFISCGKLGAELCVSIRDSRTRSNDLTRVKAMSKSVTAQKLIDVSLRFLCN